MKSDGLAVCVAMMRFPSVFFGVAVLAVDPVLLLREHEQHDDEHDQRALGGHVEAEWEAENRNDDLVERNGEEVDDVAFSFSLEPSSGTGGAMKAGFDSRQFGVYFPCSGMG